MGNKSCSCANGGMIGYSKKEHYSRIEVKSSIFKNSTMICLANCYKKDAKPICLGYKRSPHN